VLTTKEQLVSPLPSVQNGARRPLWQTLGLSALSGLLLAGSLPHLDWGWLAWFGLVPLLLCFPFPNRRTAFWHGFTLGIFYLGVMAYWLIVFAGHIIGPALSVVGWALVTAYQAFYLGVWAVGVQWLRKQPNPWAWRLGTPALWAIVEWWRQSGALGLGWGDLAYTQHLALPILQVTKLTGIWGLAFLIVLVNVALAERVRAWGKRKEAPLPQFWGARERPRTVFPNPAPQNWGGGASFSLFTTTLVAISLGYGVWTLRTEHLRPTFVAAALQGNINQNVDETPAYAAHVATVFTAQSREAAKQGARLAVWPETGYPYDLRTDTTVREQIAAEAVRDNQALLIGSAEYDPHEHKNANSLFVLSASGQVGGSYQKRQLVPFGEFVPGRKWMPFLEALHVTTFDMKRGAETQPLLDGGPEIGQIGATICFESSYPRFLREQVARGAGLLVISTDDTWFGRTAAARQHSAIAAVRAAEADRYLVRSAATGVSQVIDPTGKVLSEADLFRPAVVTAQVESRTTITPYVRWGDWFVGFCALLLVGVNAPSARVRRAGTSHSSDH
jgi:apolipoprotein N-acyltransferase